MTTLVMVQTPDDVILGWDSQLTRENEMSQLVQPKMFVRDGIVYAASGLLRAADILETAVFPEYDGSPARRWIIREWVPVFRDALRGEPRLTSEDGGLDGFGMAMVVDGTAFLLDGLMSPFATAEGIYTMGSGGDYARGALVALASRGVLGPEEVLTALRAAASIDPYTGGPLTVGYASRYLLTEDSHS